MTLNRNIGSRGPRSSTLDRWKSKVDSAAGADACHPWTGGHTRNGYGNFWDGTYTASGRPRMVEAHRAGYKLLIGDPGDLHVRHTCDVRDCCNPKHWVLGTHLDNMRDRDSRGRGKVPPRKGIGYFLDAAKVAAIRAEATGVWGEQRVLAKKYGVSHQHISEILNGKVW